MSRAVTRKQPPPPSPAPSLSPPDPSAMKKAAREAGQTQADQTFVLLRADILSCRFAPGLKLKINELCERYGVSLGSVREALSRLSADGLVVAYAQRGYEVAPVSPQDLIDLTQARCDIEALCLADSVANGGLDWEGQLLAAFHRLRFLPERNRADQALLDDQWSQAHNEFHEALVAGCNNRWLLRMRAMLSAQAERYRRLSIPLRTHERDVDAEHHQIVKALLARDADRASALMREHLSMTTRIILEGLERMGAAETATPAS